MPYSESYLKEIIKSDPILAQIMREGRLEPRKSFNELWMGTNPGLTELVPSLITRLVCLKTICMGFDNLLYRHWGGTNFYDKIYLLLIN